MSDYSYPAELIKKIENRIRAQLDGNSDIKSEEISLNIIKSDIGAFTARTEYQLDCKVDIQQSKGLVTKGRLVNAGTLDQEIQGYIGQLGGNAQFDKVAEEKIKTLPLQGFGSDHDHIDLGSEKTILTEQAPCGSCQGRGQATCQNCQGRGRTQCSKCYGTGLITCHYCQGRGQTQQGDQMRTCTQCQGRRQIYCTYCKGQKQVSCQTCQSRGVISCGTCGGAGANSTHATINPYLKTQAVINIQELDEEPKRMAAKIGGPALIRGEHATMRIYKPVTDDSNIEEQTNHKMPPAVHYKIAMPWAIGDIKIVTNEHRLSICGKKGAVAHSPKFMDQILDRPFEIFEKAASGQGYVAGLLQGASKNYRVSRETLSALISIKNPKKVMGKIAKQYSIGLSKDFTRDFVRNGYLALKRMTRRVRYIGMGLAILIFSTIAYGWFILDERTKIIHQYHDPVPYGFDALILIIGILSNITLIKGAGMLVTQKLIKSLGLKGFKAPPMGKAGLYGFVAIFLIWSGFMAHYHINILSHLGLN